MTNKELRDKGELYDANYDTELVRLMDECKDKCWQYNNIRPSDWATKDAKLREIIGSVGLGVRVQAPFWCDYGAKVVFGKNVFVAPNCGFHTAGHPLDADRRNKGLEYARPITVGDNVWFGANVVVLPGVTIGDGAVIGAGSVVTRDIPPNVVAVGNPCRILREIDQAK